MLLLDGEVYDEGHDIPTYMWISLIQDLGHEVSIEDVTDEEMAYNLY